MSGDAMDRSLQTKGESNEETEAFIPKPHQRYRALEQQQTDSRLRRWTSLLTHLAVALLVSVGWLMVLLHPGSNHGLSARLESYNSKFLASEVDFLTCGNDVEEAKESGCQYDILTNHWLPGPCADDASIVTYQEDNSWSPYKDENRTEPLRVEQLGDLPFYYTTMRDHIVHCATLWQRQYRAFSEGWKYIDQITADPMHTTHCARFLMDKADLPHYREQSIKVVVGKSGCHVRDRGV